MHIRLPKPLHAAHLISQLHICARYACLLGAEEEEQKEKEETGEAKEEGCDGEQNKDE